MIFVDVIFAGKPDVTGLPAGQGWYRQGKYEGCGWVN